MTDPCTCSCDCLPTITIPCCSGTTGSSGATGATGPAGTSILYNDLVQSDVTVTGSEQSFIVPKLFHVPATVFASNGDKIRVRGAFFMRCNAVPQVKVMLYIGGQLCNVVTHQQFEYLSVGGWILFDTEINRKDVAANPSNLLTNSVNHLIAKNSLTVYSESVALAYCNQLITVDYSAGFDVEFRVNMTSPVVPSPTDIVSCYQLLVEQYKI